MKMITVADLEQVSSEPCGTSTCNATNLEIQENSNRLMKRQRMLLFALCLLSMVSGQGIFKFSSSTYFFSGQFRVPEESVELFSSIYFLFHAIFGLFLNCMTKFFGLNTGLFTSAALFVTGQSLTAVGLSLQRPVRSLFLVILGEIVNAAGFAIVMESPPNLEVLWHHGKKILIEPWFFISMLFGIVSTQITKAALAQNGYVISKELEKLALYKAGIALVILLLALAAVCNCKDLSEEYRDLFPTPPTSSPKIGRFCNTIQLYYMDINFLLVTQAYAINFALMAWQFNFMHNVISHATSQTDAAVYWIQLAFTVGAIAGLFFGAFLSNRGCKLKLIGAGSMLFSAFNAGLFTFCLTNLKSEIPSIAFLGTWGVTSTVWLANGIQHAKGISRLPAADIPHTACLVTSSIYTVILMLFAGYMKAKIGFVAVGYFFSCLYCIGFVIISVSKDNKDY